MKKNSHTHFSKKLSSGFSVGLSVTLILTSLQGQATLTPTYERGEKLITFESPNDIKEVCVIPKHYPGAKYKKKDLDKEAELCSYNFYETGGNPDQITAATCPKENSTNPGVNIFKIPAGMSKATLEKKECVDPNASKIGKYKNSTSCSYAPGILGYYHVSRILGNIGGVPPSVLRTMDRKTHLALANEALSDLKAKPQDLIYQTWAFLKSILNTGKTHAKANLAKANLIFTDDYDQSYGAFVANPKHEKPYKEFFNGGADRAISFRENNAYFQLVKNPNPLNQIVPNVWNVANVQNLFAMKDATEFILLDHIMNQQDRFGNIAEKVQVVYMVKDDEDPNKLSLEVHGAIKEGVTPVKSGLAINTMIMKDNDCGVAKEGKIKIAGLLKLVRHMKPSTYQRLLRFQQTLPDNEEFFTRNLFFTKADYLSIKKNVDDAVSILQPLCKSGALKLDLDIEEYLETGKVSSGSCDLEPQEEAAN